MSLKDAIREAADARNKQEQENTGNQQDISQQSSEDVKTASSKAVNEASNKTVRTTSGKAVNTVSSKAVKPVSARAATTNNVEIKSAVAEEVREPHEVETAALTIRVPLDSRIHWLVSAKKQKTTLTAAITEALNERFGPAPIED